MKPLYFLLLLALFNAPARAQQLSQKEQKLYDLVMAYRKQNNLPPVPVSPSLTYVAQLHVNDLRNNKPDSGSCNMHSWSAKGKWTPCCYTPDHSKANCMWSKPRELTYYNGSGFEIACNSSDSLQPAKALELWKASSGHNAVILNQGMWKQSNWKAIGIGMSENHAVIWFGQEHDDNFKIR